METTQEQRIKAWLLPNKTSSRRVFAQRPEVSFILLSILGEREKNGAEILTQLRNATIGLARMRAGADDAQGNGFISRKGPCGNA